MNYYFFCPAQVNLYQLKSTNYFILLTYKKKYFLFPVWGNFTVSYKKEFNLISIRTIKNSIVNRQYIKSLNYFVFSWVSLISKKVKFKHKGAWISVLNNKVRLLILNFRLAHLTYLFNQCSIIRRRKKHFSFHTLLLIGYSAQNLVNMGTRIYNYFKINKFTFRGVRFSRQRLIKKEGKVSKYMIDLKK